VPARAGGGKVCGIENLAMLGAGNIHGRSFSPSCLDGGRFRGRVHIRVGHLSLIWTSQILIQV
jgi:hypothetical protein